MAESPCSICNDEGVVTTMDGQILGTCDCIEITLGSRWRSIRTGLSSEVTRIARMSDDTTMLEVLLTSPVTGDDINARMPVSFSEPDFRGHFMFIPPPAPEPAEADEVFTICAPCCEGDHDECLGDPDTHSCQCPSEAHL